jgi:hypothetical protein
MKQIEVKPGTVVVSPWYKTEEAAAYCGMARSTFEEKANKGGLPRGGDINNKRYQAEDLDRFIANGFRYPGTEEEAAEGKTRRRRVRLAPAGDFLGIIHPRTGKIYGGPNHGKQA